MPFPSLTPSGTGELYFGYAEVANAATTASSSGFTSEVTTNGNPSPTTPTSRAAVSPTTTQSPAGLSTAWGCS